MNDQPNFQNKLNRVLEKIQEIVERSADGDYIYRGEPEQYEEEPYLGKVSSNLYREYRDVEAEHFDITVVQKEILDRAREYIGEAVSDFEILTELQHRGGNTNLIDFTSDFLIALFFACDGSHGKPGRVIFVKKQSENYKIEKASNTISRANSQKSIFVQSDIGFIEPEQFKAICIPSGLKAHILDYLQKHHDISTKTIYNDLQGFIENRRIHRSAYTEFYRGLTRQERGDEAEDLKEKHDHYDSAVSCYTEALKQNSQMFNAYHNRGIAYSDKGEYDAALQDFSKVIELNPDDANAYRMRGIVYSEKAEYDAALQDFNKAIELEPDNAKTHHDRGVVHIRKDEYDAALQDFSKIIEFEPDNANTYLYRGGTYHISGEHEKAIQDFSKVIELEPDNADAYCNRGEAWLHLKEWEKARADLTFAKKSGFDIIDSFQNDYECVEDFEQKNNIQLPEDIAAMLRRQ